MRGVGRDIVSGWPSVGISECRIQGDVMALLVCFISWLVRIGGLLSVPIYMLWFGDGVGLRSGIVM